MADLIEFGDVGFLNGRSARDSGSTIVNIGPSHFHIMGGARAMSRFKCSVPLKSGNTDYIVIIHNYY